MGLLLTSKYDAYWEGLTDKIRVLLDEAEKMKRQQNICYSRELTTDSNHWK